MRAGLIIGGLFLMFIGFILFFTFILTLFGLFCGFIGFVMLIVGLFTSEPRRVRYVYQQPSYPPQQPYAPQQPYMNPAGVKYCTNCGAPNAKDAQFCSRCGTKFAQ